MAKTPEKMKAAMIAGSIGRADLGRRRAVERHEEPELGPVGADAGVVILAAGRVTLKAGCRVAGSREFLTAWGSLSPGRPQTAGPLR
jgi:hypothetical protein